MNFICGINPVLEALAAGNRHFDRLLVVKGLRNQRIAEAIARANRLGIALRFEPREALDRLANGVPHQGLIAVVSPKALLGVEQVLAGAREPALMVVLDGIEDPRNLGAILRTVEAAGADGVVLSERNSAGLSETVNRASAGALEHVKVARGGNLVQTLEAMKARGIWVVGLDASGTERWDKVDCTRPLAIVVGGEGKGIRRLVREHCDHLVSLPMFGHVGSLNVSVAAGIALYEVIRQRGLVPSHVRPIPAKLAHHQHGPSHIVGPAADDAEDDPGASIGARVAAAGGDPDDDHLAEPEPSVVEIHEEAAWAGPTVLKPVGFSRRSGAAALGARPRRNRPFGKGRGKDGRRDGREGREGRPPREGRGDAPPRTEGAADGSVTPGSDGRPDGRPGDGGRRRRGKRRGRRGGGPNPGGAPPQAPSSGSGGDGPPPAAASGDGGPPSGAPGNGKGRRRRRRRRH